MNCCIVFPAYRSFSGLTEIEQKSIRNIVTVFKNRQIFWVCPENLDVSDYSVFGGQIIRASSTFFKSTNTYSELLKLPEFYGLFEKLNFDYICIVQQDVWVFEDRLDYFCSLGYDYIGAPWYDYKGFSEVNVGDVGNGGFSLRKVSSFIEASKKGKELSRFRVGYPEDVYFCKQPELGLNIAPEDIALQFSFEENPAYCYRKTRKTLPMGTHAFLRETSRRSFWKEHIKALDIIV